jgi:hypothetical protein
MFFFQLLSGIFFLSAGVFFVVYGSDMRRARNRWNAAEQSLRVITDRRDRARERYERYTKRT